MRKLKKNELFTQLQSFLDKQGIVLKKGTVTEGLRKGCHVLTDTINLAQHSVERAQNQMEDRVDSVRKAIHDHTAPRTSAKGKTKTKTKTKAKASASSSSSSPRSTDKGNRAKSKRSGTKNAGGKRSRPRNPSAKAGTATGIEPETEHEGGIGV